MNNEESEVERLRKDYEKIINDLKEQMNVQKNDHEEQLKVQKNDLEEQLKVQKNENKLLKQSIKNGRVLFEEMIKKAERNSNVTFNELDRAYTKLSLVGVINILGLEDNTAVIIVLVLMCIMNYNNNISQLSRKDLEIIINKSDKTVRASLNRLIDCNIVREFKMKDGRNYMQLNSRISFKGKGVNSQHFIDNLIKFDK